MSHSDPIIPILAHFRPLFTAPTWKKMMTLLTGTLLARGRRTVTAALWQTGHHLESNFSRFHQVLNRARWSPLELSRHLLLLIIESFIQAGGGIDVVIDETLERRWGVKISKRGHYRDSALSSRKRSVSSPGLRSHRDGHRGHAALDGSLAGPCPFCVFWQRPLCVSEKLGKRHKTVGMRAHQMVSLLRRWLPTVPIKLIGDTAYSILELGLHCVAQHVTLIAPFRLDSVIHQPAEARTKHTIGRPRVVGKRLPSLETVLHDPIPVHHGGLVWGGQTRRGDLHCHSAVVSLWV
jgi:hypothetical protein